MRRLLLLIALTAMSVVPAIAQEVARLNIRGTVFENQSLDPLEGVQVRLTDAEGRLISGNLTQKNGQYLLPGIPTGNYTLTISFLGFKEQKFAISLPKRSGNFKVADVMLREDAKVMSEVTVEGKLPQMSVVDDTVMYNADAFKLPEGALVEELIKKLPGIVMEESGEITWNGKSISQILVDGKEFFGNNRELIMKNLPADIIDKVKAYEKQSDMARITGIDDGEEKTVLDLHIKKDRKKGWFGNITGGYGTEERYNGRLNANRFVGDQKFSMVGNANNTDGNGMSDKQSGGATMNWQKPKIELNGSASANFSQSGSQTWNNSQSFENKNAAYSNSWNKSWNRSNGFNMNYKVEWKPDSTWNILFRPEMSWSKGLSRSDSESAAFSNDPYALSANPLDDYMLLSDTIGVNHKRSANHSTSGNLNIKGSLQINKRLEKPGRNITLNTSAGYTHSTSESQNYSQIDYYQILATTGEDSLYHKVQYNTAPQNRRDLSARVSYNEPVGQKIYLQLSYQYTNRFNDRDRSVSSIFDWMNGTQPFVDYGISTSDYRQWQNLSAPDIAQCNRTTNTYHHHNMRIQLRVNRTLYELTVGANVQPQTNIVSYTKGLKHYDLRQNVTNASPTLNFRYKFSRTEQLNIRYNGNTGQPNITDLIPDTLSNADPLNIRLGNPYLKPSFTQDMQANYQRSVAEKQRSSAWNFQFRTTQNSTTNRTEYNDVTGGRISKPVNINGNWNGNTSYAFNTAMGAKQYWRIGMHTRGSFTNATGYVYQKSTLTTVKNQTRGTNASQSLQITYRRDWESGYQLEANANGTFSYNHSRSSNTSASNLDTYTFNYGVSFNLTFPWGMTLNSNIGEHSRQGYTDDAMNTNQLIWNATLTQRFLKKKNLLLSLRAVDILGQRDNVNRNVSATARTDSRSQSIYSYAMLSLTYRFGKFGGNGRGGNRGPRPEGSETRTERGGSDRPTPGERGGSRGGDRPGGFGGGGQSNRF